MYDIMLRTGERLITDEKGNVLERHHDGITHRCQSDGNWIITGAWASGPFGRAHYHSLAELAELQRVDDFRLKNGKPRYGLIDFDHGTQRLWGNKDYRGVAYVIKREAE